MYRAQALPPECERDCGAAAAGGGGVGGPVVRCKQSRCRPPQAAVEAHLDDGAKLPLGTYKALAVLDAMF